MRRARYIILYELFNRGVYGSNPSFQFCCDKDRKRIKENKGYRKARGIEEFESDVGHGGLDEDEATVMTNKKKERARLK